jgi:hypothetical protein
MERTGVVMLCNGSADEGSECVDDENDYLELYADTVFLLVNL